MRLSLRLTALHLTRVASPTRTTPPTVTTNRLMEMLKVTVVQATGPKEAEHVKRADTTLADMPQRRLAVTMLLAANV